MILIAGPCQCESFDHSMMMAERIAAISARLGRPIIFKTSFDKANRTAANSARGAGMDVALRAFEAIKGNFGLRCLTDIHEAWQASHVATAVDVLQIPALLCRQTDLIESAARTGKSVNIKKGQFLPASDMRFAVAKARDAGADEIFVTERGATYGIGDLVVDMRSIPTMRNSGSDGVIFDCTHSLQTPGSLQGSTGGRREFMWPLAMAAIAAGADGIFVETHEDPDNAPSDGPVMLQIDKLYNFLARAAEMFDFANEMVPRA